MHAVRKVTEDITWMGANDHRTHLFENIHPIPEGVSYNTYLLKDEKNVLFDTIDWSGCRQLLENLDHELDGQPLDYLVINHMEPDHGASLDEILLRHPETAIISTPKGFMLMRQFGFNIDGHELIEVREGDTFNFGKHTVAFVEAPMVHWPEAMVTLDQHHFTARAFNGFLKSFKVIGLSFCSFRQNHIQFSIIPFLQALEKLLLFERCQSQFLHSSIVKAKAKKSPVLCMKIPDRRGSDYCFCLPCLRTARIELYK